MGRWDSFVINCAMMTLVIIVILTAWANYETGQRDKSQCAEIGGTWFAATNTCQPPPAKVAAP